MSITEFVHQQVAALLEKVATETGRAQGDAADEAIHDLRVALRRLSESLRVFEQLFARGAARKVRREIKVAMQFAGEVRNHDIASDLAHKSGLAFGVDLEAGRRKAAIQLAAVLHDWDKREIFRAWRGRLFTRKDRRKRLHAKKHSSQYVWQPLEPVQLNAMQVLPSMARDYFLAGRKVILDKPEAAGLHPFRLATKRFRYTLEMFRDIYGPTLLPLLEFLKPIQQTLGEVNDCVATEVAFRAGRIFRSYLERRATLKANAFGRAWRTKFDQPGQEDAWLSYLIAVPPPTASSEAQTPVNRHYLASDELRTT